MTQCNKCNFQYIGETKRHPATDWVNTDAQSKKPSHNNTLINQVPFQITLPFLPMDNIERVPLETIISNRDAIRKAREAFLISMGKTTEPSGLKRSDEV